MLHGLYNTCIIYFKLCKTRLTVIWLQHNTTTYNVIITLGGYDDDDDDDN